MNNANFQWKNALAKIMLAGALSCSLTACVPVMLVSGAVGGGMAASDRRTVGMQTEDKVITLKGENIAAKTSGENGHVNVACFNRKVLLTGEVDSEATKQAVANEISSIENVQAVVNEIAVMAPSTIGSRSNDSLITSKVSASFLAEKDLYSHAFKTVTERGTVYLMGRVTEREGNHAAQVASGVSGVQQVVKVFEYITEEELQKMTVVQQTEKNNSSWDAPPDEIGD
ncbi:MAG: BON domain-containing protein [Oxalobacter sp.]|nr:BON domain-containing protein [Oxalobacter sp.]